MSVPKVDERAERIVENIASLYGYTRMDIYSKDRHKKISWVRHLIAWTLRNVTDANETLVYSYPEIGAVMMRDHTTTLSSVRLVDRLRSEDVAVFELTEDLLKEASYPSPKLRVG